MKKNNGFLNEGKLPFVYDPPNKSNIDRDAIRKANRKYYDIKPMKSHLNRACPKCGRYSCPGECGVKAKLLVEMIKCTRCHETVRKDASYCPQCGIYEPSKPRSNLPGGQVV